MAVGFGVLRLSSHDFWTLTPRELASVMVPAHRAMGGPPSSRDLALLMRQFPDSA